MCTGKQNWKVFHDTSGDCFLTTDYTDLEPQINTDGSYFENTFNSKAMKNLC